MRLNLQNVLEKFLKSIKLLSVKKRPGAGVREAEEWENCCVEM